MDARSQLLKNSAQFFSFTKGASGPKTAVRLLCKLHSAASSTSCKIGESDLNLNKLKNAICNKTDLSITTRILKKLAGARMQYCVSLLTFFTLHKSEPKDKSWYPGREQAPVV